MIFFSSDANAKYEKVFYDFSIKSISGEMINLSKYKNNVILLVNVASYCGFTNQYSDLQKLWDEYKHKNFVVIGVPSNSFNQEKDNEKEIKEFCEVNFNISFPMTSIYQVKVIMLMKYINGQKKIMENQPYLNGIFIKY